MKIIFPLAAKDTDRFWTMVNKGGPVHPYDSSMGPCWLWTGSTPGYGYGSFKVQGQSVNSHRMAWILGNGIPADGLFVCHSCDVPQCCNPGHLFLGTSAENTEDKRKKGRCAQGDTHYSRTNPERLARGSRNAAAKLTESMVVEIRAIYARGRTSLQRIADMFAVSERSIGRVVHNEKWKHVK